MEVKYSYLDKQFGEPEELLNQIRAVVGTGFFTLGPQVPEFEKKFAAVCGVKHAIGVGNGTDALMLILKSLGIGPGDEVITASNSFVASAGAIAIVGAKPVFADVGADYNLDPAKLEAAITPRTKAILPVHLTGNPADIDPILEIAKRHRLYVVEDAAQAIRAEYKGRRVGSLGIAAGFSLHPLKNLNVWGDGGVITTNSDYLDEKLRLWRNHGMRTRDEISFFAHNSRLDTVQAAVGLKLLDELEGITQKRLVFGRLYDSLLSDVPGVVLPPRRSDVFQVFHTYIIQADKRDELLRFLETRGIETKVHYPTPIHLQPAARYLGYRPGDLPATEEQARRILTLPIHQYLSEDHIRYVAAGIREFYGRG